MLIELDDASLDSEIHSPSDYNIDLVQDFLGDVNGDGQVNFLDIAPFIEALSSPEFIAEADIDQNGMVNFLDIAPFIIILQG